MCVLDLTLAVCVYVMLLLVVVNVFFMLYRAVFC
jgi:hypothetical protein